MEKIKTLFPGREEEFLRLLEAKRGIKKEFRFRKQHRVCSKGLFHKNAQVGNPVNCYYYTFDADIPGWDEPGNFHSVDLWFFFETLAKCWRPFKGKHYDLARCMANYWTNFVKTAIQTERSRWISNAGMAAVYK